jgi:MFS family permease
MNFIAQALWIAFQTCVMIAGGLLLAFLLGAFGYEPSYSEQPNFWKIAFGVSFALFCLPATLLVGDLLARLRAARRPINDGLDIRPAIDGVESPADRLARHSGEGFQRRLDG